MKILIAGSNGMIGSAVTRHLIENGHKSFAWSGILPVLAKSGGTQTQVKSTLPTWKVSTALSILPPCPGRCAGRIKPNKMIRSNRLATNHLLATVAGWVRPQAPGTHLCIRDGVLPFLG